MLECLATVAKLSEIQGFFEDYGYDSRNRAAPLGAHGANREEAKTHGGANCRARRGLLCLVPVRAAAHPGPGHEHDAGLHGEPRQFCKSRSLSFP